MKRQIGFAVFDEQMRLGGRVGLQEGVMPCVNRQAQVGQQDQEQAEADQGPGSLETKATHLHTILQLQRRRDKPRPARVDSPRIGVMLTAGIVGLPNVGKSTLFNALTAGHAQVDSYPFTTIDSNLGVVAVPDPRLDELERVIQPQECVPSHIEFIDIAGLVEGASQGEGLGNQFLGNIRQVDAIVHVLRVFDDSNVAHVFAVPDASRDAQVVETELLLADLELLKRAIEKRRKEWQTDPRKFATEKGHFELYLEQLEAGTPLRSLGLDRFQRQELKGLGLLTGKPLLYAANVSEEGYGTGEIPQLDVEGAVVPVSAKIEWELGQLDTEERSQFMQELGIGESGLQRLVEATFKLLGLIRFYTLANDKLRAWEVVEGTKLPQAAGKIHTDMEKGFIRAHVGEWSQVVEHGSLQGLHHHGLLRTEGREQEVRDGDVIEFFFH
jgi:GTP-binding protein YchF